LLDGKNVVVAVVTDPKVSRNWIVTALVTSRRVKEVESVEILFFTKWILKDTSMRNLAELFSTPLAA
jgi:hypothetical protein